MPATASRDPITVLELAEFRGLRKDESGCSTMADFEAVNLPMLGGCEVCGATVAAYNACPSKSGFIRCLGSDAGGCIGDEGWYDVAEANRAIFGLVS